MSYSEHFEPEATSLEYDELQYAEGSYPSLLWELERRQIDSILNETFPDPDFDYLDFACGTGRVLVHIESRARSSRGIEISSAMANRAKKRVSSAEIVCRDITVPSADVEAEYDLVTAFRFILNAEPDLRRRAMESLARRLRDENSILVFNNHGNLVSHKLLAFPVHQFRMRGTRRQSGNYLSHRSVVRLAEECGLSVERAAGCGLLGGKLAKSLPPRMVQWIESRFASSRLNSLGSNQMYVGRKQLR